MNAVHQAYGAKPQMDNEERNRIVLDLLPQVRFIARRIHERLPQHISMDDLVHAGIVGLLDAVEKFDPARNVQLKSYAKFRIRGAILDSLRDLDWSPRELRRNARRIEDAYAKLRGELGRNPSENEVAEQLGMELNQFQELLGELRGLDLGSFQTRSIDGREEEVESQMPSAPEDDPFQMCANGEMRELLIAAVGELPQKERDVLSLYYYEELTMKEIGATLSVGESRVSQIHSAAILRLRSRLRELIGGKEQPAGRTKKPSKTSRTHAKDTESGRN